LIDFNIILNVAEAYGKRLMTTVVGMCSGVIVYCLFHCYNC